MDIINRFLEAMVVNGITCHDEIIADGALHRFNVAGDSNGSQNGWYILHSDGIPSGAFGCWKRGVTESWCSKSKNELSSHEWQAFQTRVSEAKEKQENAKALAYKAAKEEAARILANSSPASDAHPYLQKKGVSSYSLYVDSRNYLIIPIYINDALQSLQFISPNGDKLFLKDGKISGGYFVIGEIPHDPPKLYIGEGYATCMTVYLAIGFPVICAFNCGNLLKVAQSFRERHPSAEIIIVGDNDLHREDNPGLTKAKETCEKMQGKLVFPNFNGLDQRDNPSDFNDLMRLTSIEEVKKQLQHYHHNPHQGLVMTKVSDITSKPIKWLWPNYIALGKLTIIAGNPGLGKSQLTAYLAALITNGGNWPICHSSCPQGSVVFLSAEDDAEDTIKPRLEAAGADVSRIFILESVKEEKSGTTTHRHFNLKNDIEQLGSMLEVNRDISVIIIDPITAYLGNTDSHKNADVRALLSPLIELAAKREIAVIAISHLNKGSNQGEALMRVSGSLGFVAAARAAYLVARDPEDEDNRLFVPLKNNLGKDQTGFAFKIQEYQLPNGIDTSKIVWSDERVTKTADEIMSSQFTHSKSAIADAEEFLYFELANGPKPATYLFAQAQDKGISEKTLRRAKDNLKIASTRKGFGNQSQSTWNLPLQESIQM